MARQIHRRAAAWYERQPGRRARPSISTTDCISGITIHQEDLYDGEVRASIQAVIEEFSVRVQLQLSTLGLGAGRRPGAGEPRPGARVGLRPDRGAAAVRGKGEARHKRSLIGVRTARRPLGCPLDTRRARSRRSPVFRSGARIAAQRAMTAGPRPYRARLARRAGRRSGADARPAQGAGVAVPGRAARRSGGGTRAARRARPAAPGPSRSDPVHGAIDQCQRIRHPSDLPTLAACSARPIPRISWDLVPVLRPSSSVSAPAAPGRRSNRSSGGCELSSRRQESPFRFAVFPDPAAQSALDGLLGADPRRRPRGDSGPIVLRLCGLAVPDPVRRRALAGGAASS